MAHTSNISSCFSYIESPTVTDNIYSMSTSSASGYGEFAEIFEKKVTYRFDRQQEEIAEIKKRLRPHGLQGYP